MIPFVKIDATDVTNPAMFLRRKTFSMIRLHFRPPTRRFSDKTPNPTVIGLFASAPALISTSAFFGIRPVASRLHRGGMNSGGKFPNTEWEPIGTWGAQIDG